jgi:hydroxymethylpyrimidine pyrophosphatase-like HAD family hydrolase
VVKKFLDNNVYVEIYTAENYYIQTDFDKVITKGHTHVLQQNPIVVGSLLEIVPSLEITKIMPIAKDEKDRETVKKIFENSGSELVMSWGVHPVILPLQFGIITAPNISKEHGASRIIENFGCSGSEVLGVGDSTSDWQFMQMCGLVGAMGNATQELKNLVMSRVDRGIVGENVDENGVLDILSHFKLIH